MKLINIVLICLLVLFIVGCTEQRTQPRQEMPAVIPPPVQTPSQEPTIQTSNVVEVDITANKAMVPNTIEIKKGTKVRWTNKETGFNFNIIIYSAEVVSPRREDVIIQSGNIAPGNSWEYTFEDSGSYKVRDIYTATTGTITASVIKVLEEGKDIGTIIVK